ncbi:hypothetical protein EJ06DRAFT_158227 [Trichodelitschia bisporula]|uniref:SnoaL-like domain-containing protein n=1 Tax=Trichodelitschia bisporula TaxID=703511 RepID=A0A6G1HLT3_9PEZI|nr:hypothetical protein EJ06DRAFT_158227 [Trichodelitschia bisporula]
MSHLGIFLSGLCTGLCAGLAVALLCPQPRTPTFVSVLLAAYGPDPTPLIARLAPSFRYSLRPSTLAAPPRNRDEMVHHAAMVTGLFDEFAMVPQRVVCADNEAVVLATMRGTFTPDTAGRMGVPTWETECVLLVRFDGAGLVEEMVEFVDSKQGARMKEMLSMGQDRGSDGGLGVEQLQRV